jgi:hypothetical protein
MPIEGDPNLPRPFAHGRRDENRELHGLVTSVWPVSRYEGEPMGAMTPGDAQAPVYVEHGVNDLPLLKHFSILSALHQNAGMEIHQSEAQAPCPASRTIEVVRR